VGHFGHDPEHANGERVPGRLIAAETGVSMSTAEVWTSEQYARHIEDVMNVVWVNGVPWKISGGMMTPLAMPHTVKRQTREEVRRAMRRTGALVARWNDAWDTEPCDWWWVCCDDPAYDVGNFKSKARWGVRKGLRESEVRQVDLSWLAEHGYEVHDAAYHGYEADGSEVATWDTRERFTAAVMTFADLQCREAWGAFVDGKLVAYAMCAIRDNAVDITESKSDPAWLKKRPNDALTYVLTKHYLTERRLLYVTCGSRHLGERSHIQELRMRLGYRRIYCPLRLELHLLLKVVLGGRAPRVAERLGLGKLSPWRMRQLKTLAGLAKIAKACRALDPSPT